MFSRRVEARITSYVSFDTTQKTSKRTSKVYELFMLADLERGKVRTWERERTEAEDGKKIRR